MAGLSKRILQYGSDEPLPAVVPLQAGPLSMIFEGGDLRTIRLGDREVIRRLYVAVRDQNWDTILPIMTDLEIEQTAASFRITYRCVHQQDEVDFIWRGLITGEATGRITFRMDGRANSTFRRNRIGFCLLHPADCAGQPYLAHLVDGQEQTGRFPEAIAPHQPVQELAALSHEIQPGIWARVEFDGDIFEMEDHRNWTDASYKTYCTPLRLPYPVEVGRGTTIQQTITVTLRGQAPLQSATRNESLIALGSPSDRPLPRLGLGLPEESRPASDSEIARLRALNLAHLRLDLPLDGADWVERLEWATVEAARLALPLEVAVSLSDAAETELMALLAELARLRPPIARWLIFHRAEKSTSVRWIALARQRLATFDASLPIGAGTNAYFAELNRGRPALDAVDCVCYSINPQVHAFDNLSLVENLAGQAQTVASARRFCGDRPLIISPVTLRPRFNPNATGTDAVTTRPTATAEEVVELPASVDPRQMSLFGAAWTVGSLKYLAEGGVAAITYYETVGWRGVMQSQAGRPRSARFPAPPGVVFPLYHILADVGAYAGGVVVPVTTDDPLLVDALGIRQADRTLVLIANLSPQTRTVTVSGLVGRAILRLLDDEHAMAAMERPEAFRLTSSPLALEQGQARLTLRPYAVARLELLGAGG